MNSLVSATWGEEGANVSELVVDHKSQKSHLGGAALVELDGALAELGLLVEGVPAEVKGAVAEVTDEVSSSDVLHDEKLKEANEGEDLEGTSDRDGGASGPSAGDRGEGGAGEVNVSRKADSGRGGQVSGNSEHADASVLEFDVTKAVELFLVTVRDQSQGIEESQRSLGTEFVLERHAEGSGGGLLGGGGKGGGAGDEGDDNSALHGVYIKIIFG